MRSATGNGTDATPALGEEAGATYTVGQVARLARVSVRTLHHYDQIGLLTPAGRTEAGYRRYGRADLERLQRILTYRRLDFELEEIRALLDDPGTDARQHLERQARLLGRRAERIARMRATIAKMLEAYDMGMNLDPEEMLEVFGDFDPTEHAAEAEERWGGTDAYRQSAERARGYRKEDWQRLGAEAAAINDRFVEAMNSGLPPTSEAAMAAAQAHREHITRWFYECTAEIHEGLAEMYVTDERFEATFERVAPGLAAYVSAAIKANAARR